jgi:hypothetical protein
MHEAQRRLVIAATTDAIALHEARYAGTADAAAVGALGPPLGGEFSLWAWLIWFLGAVLPGVVGDAYTAFIVRPLFVLYLRGPAMLGMWHGRDPVDICAADGYHGSAYYRAHPRECADKIATEFEAVLLGWWLAAALLLAWTLLSLLWRLCVVRPLSRLADRLWS